MIALTFFAALATTVSAIALPQTTCTEPTTGGVYPPYPTSVAVSYFQGAALSDVDACGMKVSDGKMEANVCNKVCTVGVAISRSPENNCTFTLYKGSASCTVEAAEKVSHPIAAGTGSVCVNTGVEDGCAFQSASGIWSCG